MNDTAVIRDLGQMAFNMSYTAFRKALMFEDNAYAQDKYRDLNRLAHAMAPFSDSTLAALTAAYRKDVS